MNVTLIAQTEIIDRSTIEENITNGSGITDLEFLSVLAGKICTGKDVPKKEDDFVKFIKKNIISKGHESLLEHYSFTFLAEGVSRALTHQLVRHRIGAYSQLSQRYSKSFTSEESSPLEDVVVPPSIENNEKAKEIYTNTVSQIRDSYHSLCELGIPKEDARFLCPNAMKTNILITWNARTIRHILNERFWKPGAQWEIKNLMKEILGFYDGVRYIFKQERL